MRSFGLKTAQVLVITVTALCAAITSTTAASALDPLDAIAIVGVPTNCGVGYSQFCSGEAQPIPVGTSDELIEVSCTATTPYVVQSTGVGCYLLGADGIHYGVPSQFLQGEQSATGTVQVLVPQQRYKLCVGAGQVNSAGTALPIQGYTCFNPL
jgi:hypothetical protein